PESPGYPQYATDIGWAVKQTSNIVKIYDLVDNYTLVFDVPSYQGQPNSSGDPNEDIKVYIEVTASALNIRENAGTQYKIVDTVPNGSKLSPVLDSKNNLVTKKANNHVWYQIYHNGSKFWISGGKNGNELVKIVKP